MKFINIPKLYVPEGREHSILTPQEVEEHTDHLQTCPGCEYVLCSCGRCHSHHCNQICAYEVPSESNRRRN